MQTDLTVNVTVTVGLSLYKGRPEWVCSSKMEEDRTVTRFVEVLEVCLEYQSIHAKNQSDVTVPVMKTINLDHHPPFCTCGDCRKDSVQFKALASVDATAPQLPPLFEECKTIVCLVPNVSKEEDEGCDFV